MTITLGNPDVRLLRPRSWGVYEQATRLAGAPTVAHLAGLGPDYCLDLPGRPLRPGCTYARASARLMDGRRSVIYAHVAREPGVRGLAAHESSWEMIQVAFDAATAEEALERGPSLDGRPPHLHAQAALFHRTGLRRAFDAPPGGRQGR